MSNSESSQLEHLVLLLTVGLCVALEEGVLTLEVAEHLLFSPHTKRLLAERGLDSLTELVHEGAELEDVASLTPARLQATLADLKAEALARLAHVDGYDFQHSKWLSRLLGG